MEKMFNQLLKQMKELTEQLLEWYHYRTVAELTKM